MARHMQPAAVKAKEWDFFLGKLCLDVGVCLGGWVCVRVGGCVLGWVGGCMGGWVGVGVGVRANGSGFLWGERFFFL